MWRQGREGLQGQTLEYKAGPLSHIETRASGDHWLIEGWASVFHAPDAPATMADSYGDLVMRGAFAASLARNPRVRLLWQHDQGEPIGVPETLHETSTGLFGRWRIPRTATGAKARELVAHELAEGLSIGFVTEEAETRPDGIRLLKQVALFEVSVVTLPAQEAAAITAWKSAGRRQRALTDPSARLWLAQLALSKRRQKLRELGIAL